MTCATQAQDQIPSCDSTISMCHLTMPSDCTSEWVRTHACVCALAHTSAHTLPARVNLHEQGSEGYVQGTQGTAPALGPRVLQVNPCSQKLPLAGAGRTDPMIRRHSPRYSRNNQGYIGILETYVCVHTCLRVLDRKCVKMPVCLRLHFY